MKSDIYILHTLTQDPCFSPPDERLWALEPGFKCGAAKRKKKRKFLFFSFALCAFNFFAACYSLHSRALFLASRWRV
jgi:hypothetical protein